MQSQIMKYWTDEYGNIYWGEAQISPADGIVCYNDRTETLDVPIIPDKGKRLIVESGKWKQIAISKEHTTEEIDGKTIYRPKNQIERYVTGVDEIPKGMKLSDDKKELLAKTLDEQLSSGEITQEEYNTIFNQPIKQQLEQIDIDSVRALREWLVFQGGTGTLNVILSEHEERAKNKRSELKK